jgi:hypothetical protein
MSKFESIVDFLSNRLSAQDRAAFEQEAASDPSLKADLELQKHIIEGVRNARRLELKSMLNSLPVGGSIGSGLTAAKIAGSVLTVAVIGTITYFVLPEKKEDKNVQTPAVTMAPEKKAEITPEKIETFAPAKENATSSPLATKPGTEKITTTTKQAPSVAVSAEQKQQPKIEVVDPTEDMVDSKGKETATISATRKSSTASRIAVDTDASNKRYNFHYQFSGSKLVLFGPFDKSLYEILEINGDQKSVFLFYKGDYYLLSDKQRAITPLEPIRDSVLIKKLKEYRGQ